MKKIWISLLCCILFSSCTSKMQTPLIDAVKDYPKEVAIEEDCVVIQNGQVIHGKNDWENFLTKTKRGQKATIRLADYSSNILDELIEEECQIVDLEYDGSVYKRLICSEDAIYTESYSYLLKDEYENCYVYYLDHDDEAYEEAMRKRLSSVYEIAFSFRTLFKETK